MWVITGPTAIIIDQGYRGTIMASVNGCYAISKACAVEISYYYRSEALGDVVVWGE